MGFILFGPFILPLVWFNPTYSPQKKIVDHAAEVFGNPHDKSGKEQKELIDQLYKNIGRMQVENDWLKKKLDV